MSRFDVDEILRRVSDERDRRERCRAAYLAACKHVGVDPEANYPSSVDYHLDDERLLDAIARHVLSRAIAKEVA